MYIKASTIGELKKYYDSIKSIDNPINISPISNNFNRLFTILSWFGDNNDNLNIFLFDNLDDTGYELQIEKYIRFIITLSKNNTFISFKSDVNDNVEQTIQINEEYHPKYNAKKITKLIYATIEDRYNHLTNFKNTSYDYQIALENLKDNLMKIKNLLMNNQLSLGIILFETLYKNASDILHEDLPF